MTKRKASTAGTSSPIGSTERIFHFEMSVGSRTAYANTESANHPMRVADDGTVEVLA